MTEKMIGDMNNETNENALSENYTSDTNEENELSLEKSNSESETETSEILVEGTVSGNENTFFSVSGNDCALYTQVSDLYSEDILKAITESNNKLDSILEYKEKEESIHEETTDFFTELLEYKEFESMTLFDKPLEDYTTLEGIGLITVILFISVVIYKLIGGIISVWNL